ncbi:MAG TPA: hypothetical protein VGU20_10535 [Stellaceae bacterium]|nr:hypothetical protein [Stellaceae bacterium]
MADTVAGLPSLGLSFLAGAALPTQLVIELAQQPPSALLAAAIVNAVVIGRGSNGTLLLSTDSGPLTLKTNLSPPPGSKVQLRLLPGTPPAVTILHVESGEAPPPEPAAPLASPSVRTPAPTAATPGDAPPARLDLGTEVTASVIAPPPNPQLGDPPPGTRLLLRVALPAPTAPSDAGAPSAPRGALTGTVIESPPGVLTRTTLNTPFGIVGLDKRLALPLGTPVSLARLAVLPPLSPSASLGTGIVVDAKVIAPSPSDPTAALAAGTRLVARLTATPPLPGIPPAAAEPILSATVAPGPSGETVLDTPIGLLTLDRRLNLPVGTALGLQRLSLAAPDPPSEAPLAQRKSWPALDEALQVLDRAAPDLAARLRSDLMPRSGAQLAGTLLFLVTALSNGSWPSSKATAALDAAGHRILHTKLDGDVTELRQLSQSPSGDWRIFVLPLLDGGVVRPVRLYLRRRQPGRDPNGQGARFVLDVDLSRLGAVQLDGLIRQQRFDLVLRSHRAIPAQMRQEITRVFHDASSAAGLSGDIIFTTASRFAVAPLEALGRHIGVQA